MNVTQDMLNAAVQAFDDTYDVESFPIGDNKSVALKVAIEAALRIYPLPKKADLSKWYGPMNCPNDHDTFEAYGHDLGWNACIAAIEEQRQLRTIAARRKEGES